MIIKGFQNRYGKKSRNIHKTQAITSKKRENELSEFSYLKCWYTNAEFITNKIGEFQTEIYKYNPDIIAIVESGLKSDQNAKHYFPDEALSLDGYTTHGQDNIMDYKGGILIYTKDILYTNHR